MEIEFLRHYGFKPKHVEILRSAYGPNLLPLQERVIRYERLFEGESLVIAAPTSSGKTFLAEILFLHYAMRGGNAVLLVPTKALANQRYRQWRERYEPLGYKIYLSTRDHPFHDDRIRRGDFHLAIVIYEKLRALLAQEEGLAYSLGACVVDELHYLFDPRRGPSLEMLLTRLRRNPGIQFVGLTALEPDASLCEWLDAKLAHDTKRPVELRQGVLCNGTFLYREFNSNEIGRENFPLEASEDEGEAMLSAARYFASRGETTLLFWPTRDLCYRAARRLAAEYEPDLSVKAPELDRLEATVLRQRLADLLPRRIAIHTGDLSPEEREIVERAVWNQEAVIICATGTLAEGVNFPVVNVITSRRTYSSRPEDIQAGRPPTPAPISPDRLWNMIGRAGRLGLSDFGRGILLTNSQGDVDGLFSVYLDSPRGQRRSTLTGHSWPALLLHAAPATGHFTRESLEETLNATLCAVQKGWPRDWRDNLEIALSRLDKEGFIRQEYDRFELTALGQTAAAGGLSIETALRLRDAVRTGELENAHPLSLLLLVALTQEMEGTYVYVSRNEILSHTWTQALAQCADDQDASSDGIIRTLMDDPSKLAKRHHEAFKKTLILTQWISEIAIGELEQRFQTHAGVIARLGEETAWVLGRLAEIAAAHAIDAERVRRVQILQERAL